MKRFGKLGTLVIVLCWAAGAISQQDQPASKQTDTQAAPQAPAIAEPQAPSNTESQETAPKPKVKQQKKTGAEAPPRLARKHKKRSTAHKNQDGKVVVRNGGAKDNTSQLSPGISKEQEQHDRENTNQLLTTTDANLKTVAGRQLNASQQSMLNQIHTYVSQSKAASSAGDLPRAHTLAYKAHLLSDELAKK